MRCGGMVGWYSIVPLVPRSQYMSMNRRRHSVKGKRWAGRALRRATERSRPSHDEQRAARQPGAVLSDIARVLIARPVPKLSLRGISGARRGAGGPGRLQLDAPKQHPSASANARHRGCGTARRRWRSGS
jgi:hypothetical protein